MDYDWVKNKKVQSLGYNMPCTNREDCMEFGNFNPGEMLGHFGDYWKDVEDRDQKYRADNMQNKKNQDVSKILVIEPIETLSDEEEVLGRKREFGNSSKK